MYIDIDVHHGDGVEEAFYDNDRVLTVSLHKHGDNFFPNTGSLITSNKRAVNVPLQTEITDETYKYIFEPVIANCVRKFNPGAIVFEAGTDSLAEDKLGFFSLSVEGHASCLKFVSDLGIPLLVLGGGGYTIQNVARCWAYETAVLCDFPIPDYIPTTDPFIEHFAPDYLIKPQLVTKYRVNHNGKRYLDSIISFIQDRVDKFD